MSTVTSHDGTMIAYDRSGSEFLTAEKSQTA